MNRAKVLAPIEITSAMITASTVAEPDTGETLWNPATSYAIGDKVIRTETHRVYTALAAGIDAGLPEATPLRWFDTAPTNKMAAFDIYRSTAMIYTGTLTMTIKPGIITGMAFFGLVGDTIRVICKDALSLAVYYDQTFSLSQYLSGDLMWEFYYGIPRQQDGLRIDDLYPHDAQIEITLTPSPVTGKSQIGIWAIGSFEPIGSPEYGFKAQPVDYSRITTDSYGNTTVIKGLNARNLNGECIQMSTIDAQAAADVIYRVLGTPCAWVICDANGFDYLNAFGLGSADLTASGPNHATLSLNVRGLI